MSAPKPRHEVWRESYRANRYLNGKPEAHLRERFRYIVETILTLTDAGKIGFQSYPKLGAWLWARLTHTMEEFSLRGMGLPPDMLDRTGLPKTTVPNRPKAVDAYGRRKRKEPGEVFKFGKRKRIEAMLMLGEFRFAGASIYQDPSLNAAVRDDELDFTIFPSAGSKNLPPELAAPPGMGWGRAKIKHPTDYYVLCLGRQWAPRLFDDFAAEACLIVYDGKEFGRRLIPMLKGRLPNWTVGSVSCSYIDPDDPGSAPIVIPVAKHMKYAYQVEERVICHTPRGESHASLPPFTVQLGSIEDIAEMIVV